MAKKKKEAAEIEAPRKSGRAVKVPDRLIENRTLESHFGSNRTQVNPERERHLQNPR